MTAPSFLFFRSHPASHENRTALASSMQSLDSVLLLIALGRYPHALTTCAAAVESAIKLSAVGKALGSRQGLSSLLEVARRESEALSSFPEEALLAFRKARNRFTHEGFSPRDDSESVGLLLEVGLPFLQECYVHLFAFDLWDALLPDHVDQLRIARSVYVRAKAVEELDRSYCLKGFIHLVRWNLKDNFSAEWELEALDRSIEVGEQFELKYRRRKNLEHLFAPECILDCPLCREPEGVVAQLDEIQLDSRSVVPLRLACTNCGIVVRKEDLYLGEELLKNEIIKAKEMILLEYGL